VSRYREITAILEANAGAKRLSGVFEDFVEMSALAFRNTVDPVGRADREALYLRIAGQYERVQLDRFAHALALVVLQMEESPQDVLGRLYMELALGNERLGQFYTPYDVAQLIATMSTDPGAMAVQIRHQGFVEVYEPACGAGAFLVALSRQMDHTGIDYQRCMHVTAEDISPQAVHMAYIQLTLLHVPAVVHHRNSLTQETFDSWRTPAHVLGGWDDRLRALTLANLKTKD
jgi:type I restriction-modification system DNA methylase subunit